MSRQSEATLPKAGWKEQKGPIGCLIVLIFCCFLPHGMRYLSCFVLSVGVVLELFHLFRLLPERVGRFFRRVLWTVILLFFLFFLFLEELIIGGGHTRISPEAPPDVVVVLGCSVNQAGPTPMLQDRLDAAASYLKEHPEIPCVVCGGQGEGEPTTEAMAMAEYLIAAGVEASRIWQEDRSVNTVENLRNAGMLLEGRGYDMDTVSVLLVTSNFHLYRAEMLAGRYGLQTQALAASGSTPWATVSGFLRESLALVKSYLFD